VVIEAAGGAIWRTTGKGATKVLLVHRDRYDDWTLPKGKLEPGETHHQAALREVEEETGFVCSTGAELPEVRYRDRKDRAKRVRYWAMEIERGDFEPNDEVDEIRWLLLEDATALLTYAHDQVVLDGLRRLQD
jgi:8-oxo-dGTP pyrophosphatase MutT (NUDIX family)